MTPLSEVPTFGDWLDDTPYTESRKAQLEVANDECLANGGIWSDPKYTAVKSFMKDETYTDYKYPRAINSRHDAFKCACAPFFKAIEKELFKLPFFIKKVPVRDRPAYILERLYAPGAKYIATDYTAFESLFTKELMMDCEFILYEYMTANLAEGRTWFAMIRKVLGGINRLAFKHFILELVATRMSGEMCTSLGNSFCNLMAALFILAECGTRNAVGVVEGDDGLFRVDKRVPTIQDFADLGLNIKIELHDDVATASFCGLIFDRDDLANVTDPREVLASFGWTSAKYLRASDRTHKMLLRAKALSLLYQYPGCPILQPLALWAMRHTDDIGDLVSPLGRP